MNTPAVEFYKSKGVDITKEPLEIALCAQHNNGGLSIDQWWQTNIEGFFAAGEVSASHGVYRPGGSALNAGQVGSARAARYIAQNRQGSPMDAEDYMDSVLSSVQKSVFLCDSIHLSSKNNIVEMWDNAAKRMSKVGAAIRDSRGILEVLEEIKKELGAFYDIIYIDAPKFLPSVYRLHDILISQYVYLRAMADYSANGGKSRGSALYYDKNGAKPFESLPEIFRYTLDDGSRGDLVQETSYLDGSCCFHWRKVRDIPKDDDFFENVWRSYRENGNVY